MTFGKPQNETTFEPNDPASPLNQDGYVGVDPFFRTPGTPLAADAPSRDDEEDEKVEEKKTPASSPSAPPAPVTPAK